MNTRQRFVPLIVSVALATSGGTTMVAGVITTLPGVLMNKTSSDESAAPALALVGRVPVKIVGEGGAIRPVTCWSPRALPAMPCAHPRR